MRALVALIAVLLVGAAPIVAQQTEMAKVNVEKVNLRTGPSIDSAAVKSLSRGTTVTVVSHMGAWSKVSVNGTSGWVRSDLLAALPASTSGSSSSMAPPPAAAPSSSRASNPPPPPPAPTKTTSTKPAPPPPPPPAMKMGKTSSPSTSASKEGVRFSIFAGIVSKQDGEPSTPIAGGFSLLFPVARMVSIGPELTGFYTHEKIDADNSFGSIDAAAALMVRIHSNGKGLHVYGEVGPALVTPVASIDKVDGVSTTTTGTDIKGAVALGAGIYFGPLVIGAHYHAHLATGGGHVLYFTAGLTF